MFSVLADCKTAAHPLTRFSRLAARGSLLLFLGCLVAARSGAQSAEENQPRKISGTVINSVTKAPIPRALVSTSDNRFAMLTDGEGHFEFTVPGDNAGATGTFVFGTPFRFGNCWVTARKPGFFYDCNEQTGGARSSSDEQTVALVPEGLIYGHVTLGASDTLAGTAVHLFFKDVVEGLPRWTPASVAQTNSAGEFRFAELRAGEYKMFTYERADEDSSFMNEQGEAYGYPPAYYPAAADLASAAIVRVSAGQAVQADFAVARQRYYRVRIPVSNEDISFGMNVTVNAQSGPGFSLGYNSNTKGIEGFLPNGNYVVQATAYSGNVATGIVNLRVNSAAVEGPPMTLVPASSITLDVKEEFSEQVSGDRFQWSDGRRNVTVHGPRAHLQANVISADEFHQARGAALRPPTAPDDNSMVLENLEPGRYWLQLYPSRGYIASARMGDLDVLHEPIEMTAGHSARVEIEMRDDTAEIDGSVTGAAEPVEAVAGLAAPLAWIYCVPLPDSAGQFQRLIASEEGKFNSPSIAPGAYRILAFSTPKEHLPYRDAEAMKAYETKGPVVHLSAGQKLSVQVPLISEDVSEK